MPLSSRKYTLHYCLLPSMKYTKHGVHCRYMGGHIGTLLLMLKQDFSLNHWSVSGDQLLIWWRTVLCSSRTV